MRRALREGFGSMLEWLTGNKKRRDLPEYSRLRTVPTRTLPADLVQEEAGDSFAARYDAIARDLRTPAHQPQDDTPLFTELMTADGSGAVTFPLPDGSGQCLPVFSSPFRAADYARTVPTSMPRTRYLSSTALQLLNMIRDLERVGITALTIDRCPRCSISIVAVFCTSSLKAARDLLEVWTIQKTGELARLSLYCGYAVKSARAGNLENARDVALETVGHVSLEDPRPHLLLGKLALALGDRTLLREAKEFLVYFKHDPWYRKLDQIGHAGSPTFEEPD